MTKTVLEVKDGIVFENDNYKIALGTMTVDSGPEIGKTVNCYDLINKATGVVETQANVFPAVLQHAVQWDAIIKEALKIAEGPGLIDIPKLVPPKNLKGK